MNPNLTQAVADGISHPTPRPAPVATPDPLGTDVTIKDGVIEVDSAAPRITSQPPAAPPEDGQPVHVAGTGG